MPQTLAAIGAYLSTTAGATTVAATAVAAVGANVQYQASQRAAEAQQAAANTQQRRQQVQALREAQIKRAIIQQQSANSGTLNSSGYGGGVSSLQSQLGSNLGYGNTMTMLGNQANAAVLTADRAGAATGLVNAGLNFASQMPMSPSSVVDANAMNTTSAYDGFGAATGRPMV